MMSFSGDFLSRRKVDLVGKSWKERDRNKLRELARIEKQKRQHHRLETQSAVKLQKEICNIAKKSVEEKRESWLGSNYRPNLLYSTLDLHNNFLDSNEIHSRDCSASMGTYCSLLQTCIEQKALTDGKKIHDHIIFNGCECNLLLGNLLLDMYVSCGFMQDAKKTFDTFCKRNLCSWAFLFKGYAGYEQWEELLAFFWKMWGEGVMPNGYIFAVVLQACANLVNVCGGKEVHACIIKSGCKVTKVVASALVSMYTKCGSLDDARLVFDKVPSRNVVLWSALLAGYAHHGHANVAIVLFWQMQNDGVEPNEVVCISILKACAKIRAHNEGRKVHDCIVKSSFDLRVSVGNTLIDMYTKCGCLNDACAVFDRIAQPDVISWSALIAGYGEHGNGLDPFKLLSVMESKGIYVNEVTFLNLLKGCTNIEHLDNARVIHAHVIMWGLTFNGCLENSLLDVYAKCGKLEDANYIFENLSVHNVVSWSALIMGHAHNGLHKDALMLFNLMQEEGIRPNATTFVGILKVSAGLRSLEVGKWVHFGISEDRLETELVVGSALVDMYAKCGAVREARQVFDHMPKRNIVAWSSIIACYVHQETAEEAVKLFWLMQREGVKPDEITFASVLKACTIWVMLEEGKRIHKYALNMGNKLSFFLGSTLVDMYTRCGSLDKAHHVFVEIEHKDAALWNSLIIGYGQHGLAFDAFRLLCQMEHQGMELNRVTFVGLLSACSHAGLLEEGIQVFDSIRCEKRTIEHCVCVVDLLGRAGCLHQAVAFVQVLPSQPDATIWLSLVGACRLCLNLKLATYGVESLLEVEPENAVAYVLLSNIVYEAD